MATGFMHIPRRVHYVGARPIGLHRSASGRLVVPIEIANFAGAHWVVLEAATGGTASHLIVPAPLLSDLGITPTRRAPFQLADGAVREYDTGEVQFRLVDRHGYTPVVFAEPDATVLLGQVVLTMLLLAVDATTEQLVPIEGWQ